MKSIIIVGNQMSGKTTLARDIARAYGIDTNVNLFIHHFIINNEHLNEKIKTVVFDELANEKDLEKFKAIIAMDCFTFRPAYQKDLIQIRPLIIGVFQSYMPEFINARHLFIFDLRK